MALFITSLTYSRRRVAAGIAAITVATGGLRRSVAAQESTPGAGGMTVEEAQQVFEAYAMAVASGGDIGQYMAEDVILRYMDTGEEVAGRQQVVDEIITLHTITFDAQVQPVNLIVGAGALGGEAVFVGTHTDEFAGIAATGASVNVPYSVFYTLEESLITEMRMYGLMLGLMHQLSAAEPAGATPIASGGAAEGTVNLELFEFGIEADTTTLTAGQPYTFVATNVGDMVHELVIEPAGAVDEPLEKGGHESEIEDIAPGATAEMTWTFDEAGAYQFACHIEGHYEEGMVLVFQVM